MNILDNWRVFNGNTSCLFDIAHLLFEEIHHCVLLNLIFKEFLLLMTHKPRMLDKLNQFRSLRGIFSKHQFYQCYALITD